MVDRDFPARDLTAPLPDRPPVALIAVGVALFGLALFFTPERIAAMGPLRSSLAHENDFVRSVAEWEVLIARLSAALLGGMCLAAAVFWPKLSGLALTRKVQSHRADPLARGVLSTRSFLLVGGAALAAIAVALASTRPEWRGLAALAFEDGPAEYATALLFLLAAAFSAVLAVRLPAARRRCVHALLAIAFLLCAGEEISWGQRIFVLETPEALGSVNAQGEINLHNSLGYAADHLFILGVFAYGVLLPLLVHRHLFFRNLVDMTGVPVASLGLAGGLFLASLIHPWTIGLLADPLRLRVQELRELVSALGFLMLMVETFAVHGRRAQVNLH